MSHLHIPDGVLPLWLVVLGWALTGVVVALCARAAARDDLRRRVPLVGAIGALMLVAMSSEVVPIAYHINLAVVAGILLGPWLSPIAALVVVTVLALVGHGGVTVIGLNTLVIASEMVLGWALFTAVTRVFGRSRPGLSAGAATVATLTLTTTLLVVIVALGGPPAATRESGALDPSALRFDNPFAEGVVSNPVLQDGEEPEPERLDLRRFATMVFVLGSIGWVLEALITGAIVGFVARVRPALVWGGALAQPGRSTVGDEGMHR